MKKGWRPRCEPVNGLTAGVEFALFLLPISIIHYLPNFFFGSLLMLFGVEILADWLIHSYKKAGFLPSLALPDMPNHPCCYQVVHTALIQERRNRRFGRYFITQVSRAEFVLLWATFVAIMLTDLERGILIGIIMAVLYFAYSYAQASTHTMKAPPPVLSRHFHSQEDGQCPVCPSLGLDWQ